MATPFQLMIGSVIFNMTLDNNPTAAAFRSLLPLDLQMSELNGNEKYVDLYNALPNAATNPGRIRTGDLMLYGSRTLVLWYEDYSTTYTYTRIASMINPEGLPEAVGSGSVGVRTTFNGQNTDDSTSPGIGNGTTPRSSGTSRVGVLKFSRSSWLLTIFLGLTYVLEL